VSESADRLDFHPYANIFPMMSSTESSTLKDVIVLRGLRNPIVLFEGMILDGRNRYRQCIDSGVEPEFEYFSGTNQDALDLVRSLNLCRRDLSSSQRAACSLEYEKECAKLAKERHAEGVSLGGRTAGNGRPKTDDSPVAILPRSNSKAREQAAEAFGTSARYVQDAKKIAQESPETLEKVKNGELTIPQAKKEIGLAKPKPTGQSRVNGELVDDPPDIAKQRAKGLIPEGVIPDITEREGETLEDVKEDIDERESIKSEQSSDDAWLDDLPLSKVLKDRPLKRFRAESLKFRSTEKMRDSLKRKLSELVNSSRINGPYSYQLQRALTIKDPSQWVACPPLDKGGCGGTGQVPKRGDCKMCFSEGFRVV
jgi:hypothetical protein